MSKSVFRNILDTRPVSNYRLEKALNRVLTSRTVVESLNQLASEPDVLRAISPELAGIVSFGGDGTHKNLWDHTCRVVAQTPPVLTLRWAALFHDVGKPRCMRRTPEGVAFHGHEHLSARMFEQFYCRNRFFTPVLRKNTAFLIQNLGWVEGYSPEWTDSAVRRFARNAGDYSEDLITLSQADITTKHDWKRNRIVRQLEELKVRIRDIRAADAKEPLLPKGLGTALGTQFGIPPSRRIGDLLKMLEARVEDGDLGQGLGVEVYVDYVQSHRGQFGLGP